MPATHSDYLALLGQVEQILVSLCSIETRKTDAVCKDDLEALNECMKQEQVQALALRSAEKKRLELAGVLGLEGTTLSMLAERFPKELYFQAKKAAESLIRQYQLYRGAADASRSTLECSLHEIEVFLEQKGVSSDSTPGYEQSDPSLPSTMRTDFRA